MGINLVLQCFQFSLCFCFLQLFVSYHFTFRFFYQENGFINMCNEYYTNHDYECGCEQNLAVYLTSGENIIPAGQQQAADGNCIKGNGQKQSNDFPDGFVEPVKITSECK